MNGSNKSIVFSTFERKVVSQPVFLEKIGVEEHDLKTRFEILAFGSIIAFRYSNILHLLTFSSEKCDFEYCLQEMILLGESKKILI